MQGLTTHVELTIARQAVTNDVKPMERTYQATAQAKEVSPEILYVIEADVFDCTESNMRDDVMVSHRSLYRGLRPWHGMRWKLNELGRSSVFLKGYAGTSQQRQGLVNDAEEVGLTDSTLSMGKPCTWGSGQQYSDGLSTCLTNPQR